MTFVIVWQLDKFSYSQKVLKRNIYPVGKLGQQGQGVQTHPGPVRSLQCIQSDICSLFSQVSVVYSVRALQSIQSGLCSVFSQVSVVYSVRSLQCIQSGLCSLFSKVSVVYSVRYLKCIQSGLCSLFSQISVVYPVRSCVKWNYPF